MHPVVRTLWLPRLIDACTWIETQVDEGRSEGRTPAASEVKGEAVKDGITVYGRADRIDQTPGGIAIIDYKTGNAPSNKQVKEGFALQLGLLGFIASQGGFERGNGAPDGFEYWSFRRDGDSFGKISTPAGGGKSQIAPDAFVDFIVTKFREAAARWLTGDEPFIAKLHPDYGYGEFDHLMRLEEWQGRDG